MIIMYSKSAARPRRSLTTQEHDFAEFKHSQPNKQRANLLGTRPNIENNKSKQQQQASKKTAVLANSSSNQQSPQSLIINDQLPTSRLCVKNLPSELTSVQLQSHFSVPASSSSSKNPLLSKIGVSITDCKVLQTPDGRSRKFAFIGFINSEMAITARNYFNSSYIGMNKLNIEFAREKGSEQLERPWSQYSQNSSKYQHKHQHKHQQHEEKQQQQTEKIDLLPNSNRSAVSSLLTSVFPNEKAASLAADPKLADYLHVMSGKGQSKFWENDELVNNNNNTAMNKKQQQDQQEEGIEEKERQKLLKMINADQSDDEAFNNPSMETDSHQNEHHADPKNPSISTMSDTDYFKTKQVKHFDDDDDSEDEQKEESEEDDDDDEDSNETSRSQQFTSQEERNQEKENSTTSSSTIDNSITPLEIDDTRLFIRNLPFHITETDLESHFSPFGEIQSVHIPRTADHQGKGFAFLTFYSSSAASAALTKMNNKIVMGRIIHILFSQRRPPSTSESNPDDKSSPLNYKQRLEQQRKKTAGSEHNWNTLFLRADTVMSSMAEQLNVDKGAILDRDESALAVRLALAETHLINQTKKWLTENGVNIERLTEEKPTRSKHLILVKNIPYESESIELQEMFSKFGQVKRVLLPPAKTMALIEFANENDANKGFMGLAYRKYHHVPLYLEWAPVGVIKNVEEAVAAPITTPASVITDNAETDESLISDNTIFVKNLNFSTTEASLLSLFSSCAPVRSVNIAKKKNSKNNIAAGAPSVLSMGYGFVELRNPADVENVIKQLQNTTLDEHVLQLKRSTRAPTNMNTTSTATTTTLATAATSAIPSSRLIVKNLPFEATSSELRSLLTSFGSITRVRVPRKYDGGHRGFAFVDFATKQEAKNALEQVKHTHLYGRRLVLQWTEEGEEENEEVEQQHRDETHNLMDNSNKLLAKREKAKRQYEASQSELPQHKRSKKEKRRAEQDDADFV